MIVVTLLLLVYFGFYSLNKTAIFFDLPVHIFTGNYAWYDSTFLQFIILTVAAVYVLALVIAFLAIAASTLMPNYISVIGIQIPVIAGLLIFGLNYLITRIISIWVPQWVNPFVYTVMVLVSVIIVIVLWKREAGRDIIV